MSLNRVAFREIVDLLTPHAQTVDRRRALLTLALGLGHSLLRQINYEGETDIAVINIIDALVRYDGDNGHAALIAVLDEIDTRVGESDKERIARLKNTLMGVQPVPANVEANFEQLLQDGENHLQNRDFPAAIDVLTQAIQVDASSGALYALRGSAYKRMSDFDHAIEDYTEALRLDPTKADYLEERARAYTRKKAYKEAIADYTQAIKLRPKRSGFYVLRAEVFRKQGLLDKAKADLRKAVSMGNQSARKALEKL
jgi:tetratricopeptide (TPR) repeat protein